MIYDVVIHVGRLIWIMTHYREQIRAWIDVGYSIAISELKTVNMRLHSSSSSRRWQITN